MNAIRYITVIGLYICSTLLCVAQNYSIPSLPEQLSIGGLQLTFTSGARKKIQADIQMIYANQKYLQQKVDRANLYFPIIERIFSELNFPDEVKYLALQESSLISDAVSSSNAVGFWQFKKESAIEVGVQVNESVDERKHIVYSTKGAAAYLKRNNAVVQNWIYAILSYNLGAGGVKPHIKQKYVGAAHMLIEEDLHWYALRFIAYKVAYEPIVNKSAHPTLALIELTGIKNKSFIEISKETKVDLEVLKEYNKWCIKDRIPQDKDYIVLLPVQKESVDQYKPNVVQPTPTVVLTPSTKFPDVATFKDSTQFPVFASVNGVKAIRASASDDINSLALKAGLKKESFLYYNELSGYEKIKYGHYYFLQLKRTKALVREHVVQPGESIWDIAQQYAVTTSSIRKKNRMSKNEMLRQGRVLWLRDKRPMDQAIEYRQITVPIRPSEPKFDYTNSKRDTFTEGRNSNLEVRQNTNVQFQYHKVQSGETVFAISRLYQVDSDSIRLWNQLSGYSIQVGQQLIVGKKIMEQKSSPISHVVSSGETLYQISKRYGTTSDKIMKDNTLNSTDIKPGQVLLIYP
ncbi:MAG: LysM peptidoglycan-binding domain-containing protein [Cytophagaceae bacterium]|jgi:membrane-bound lytic murein transglycosylase D|nr:LysM peptidoglycan-binding domain-containing protein [Cytophagaceae bacterium]